MAYLQNTLRPFLKPVKTKKYDFRTQQAFVNTCYKQRLYRQAIGGYIYWIFVLAQGD
jgi:hypothetical protein